MKVYLRLLHVLPELGAPAYRVGEQAGHWGAGGQGWRRLLRDNDGEGGVRLLLVHDSRACGPSLSARLRILLTPELGVRKLRAGAGPWRSWPAPVMCLVPKFEVGELVQGLGRESVGEGRGIRQGSF